MNGHVNNSKYLDWIFEVMGADFLTNHIPQKILRHKKAQICPKNPSKQI